MNSVRRDLRNLGSEDGAIQASRGLRLRLVAAIGFFSGVALPFSFRGSDYRNSALMAGSDFQETVESIECPLDPNSAEWWELTELPRVGESLARQIVEHRRILASASTSPASAGSMSLHLIPFRSAEDLLTVRGIGRATLERIRPFLRFPRS